MTGVPGGDGTGLAGPDRTGACGRALVRMPGQGLIGVPGTARSGVAGQGRSGVRSGSGGGAAGGGAIACGSGGGAAEVLTGCAYRGVVRTEHGGPGGRHAAVVAAGLVPVAQLLGHPGEVEAEREHQRIGLAAAALAGRVGLFEYAPGGGRVVGLPVQPGQQVTSGQDVLVVLAVRRAGRDDRVGEQAAGACQVTRGAQRESLVLSGDQRGGVGHVSNAARNRLLRATHPIVVAVDLRKRAAIELMCMIVLGRVQ